MGAELTLRGAEVRTARLVVPRAVLEALPERGVELGLQLAVSLQGRRLAVTVVGGVPALAFRLQPDGKAELESAELAGDERGELLFRVLGPLALRFGGELEVALSWSAPGQPAELRVRAGKSDYPGLQPWELLPVADEPGRTPSPEEQEIQSLLERAASEWARYQGLKQKGR